jgi:hypothetical protein
VPTPLKLNSGEWPGQKYLLFIFIFLPRNIAKSHEGLETGYIAQPGIASG